MKELNSVQWYSFTTDIWSTEVSNDSLLSFTVHWLSEVFEKKEAVLHAHPLPGSHTGEMLCREYNTMLSNWNIDNEQVHLIVRDNASNMVKAMSDGDFEDLGCFAHTLQLGIKNSFTESCYRPSSYLLTNSRALQAFTTCIRLAEVDTRQTTIEAASTQARCFYPMEQYSLHASSDNRTKDGISSICNRIWRCSTAYN